MLTPINIVMPRLVFWQDPAGGMFQNVIAIARW